MPATLILDTAHGRRDDIHLLDELLERTIRRQAGEEVFALLKDVQEAAQALRARPSVEDARRLRDRLDTFDLPTLRTLIRAERLLRPHQPDRAAGPRPRHPRPHGPGRAEPDARERRGGAPPAPRPGRGRGRARRLLGQAFIVPVFTAHPSEARRLTVLEKLSSISRDLDRLEYTSLLPQEKAAVEAEVAEQVETFWLTNTVRADRPTVLDEVRQALEVVEGCLFGEVPRLYAELETSLAAVYPGRTWKLPSVLRFGSWIGGDRDGNPNVTHAVTAQTVRLHQETILKLYIDRVEASAGGSATRPSSSPAARRSARRCERDAATFPELVARMWREPYRGKCRVIAARLAKTLAHVRACVPHWARPARPAAGGHLRHEGGADRRPVGHRRRPGVQPRRPPPCRRCGI